MAPSGRVGLFGDSNHERPEYGRASLIGNVGWNVVQKREINDRGTFERGQGSRERKKRLKDLHYSIDIIVFM